MGKDIFLTHFNYERVFRVEVNGFTIKIYKHTFEALQNNEKCFILELKTHKYIYVGFKPDDPYDKFYIGNTLLIKISDTKYMFVGEIIYIFDLDETILAYSSNVIRGQPFPYFITSKYCYLLLDHVRIPLDYDGDPYEYYYNNILDGADEFDYRLVCDNYLR